jgi:hypothetical protein
VHLKGLEAIVNSRGGIQTLTGFPRVISIWSVRDITISLFLLNVLDRIDNITAVLLEEKPRFDFAAWNIIPPVIERHPFNSTAVRYKNKLINLTCLAALSKETIDVYWIVRTVSLTKQAVTMGLLKREIHESYSDVLNYLERRTLLITLSKEYSHTDSATSVFYLFSNALTLHIIMFLRDQTRGIPMLTLLCTRIRHCLEQLDLQILQFQYPEMMLWILIMGGIGTADKDTRIWYAKHLADACNASGLRGGDELAIALQDFLWIELYRTPVTSQFWRDVAKAQGVRHKYETQRLKDSIAVIPFNNRFFDAEDCEPPELSPNNTFSPKDPAETNNIPEIGNSKEPQQFADADQVI